MKFLRRSLLSILILVLALSSALLAYRLLQSKPDEIAKAGFTTFSGGSVSLRKQYVYGQTIDRQIIDIRQNQSFKVRLKYNNTGSSAASGVSITDTILEGFTFTPGSIKNCFVDIGCVTLSDSLVNGSSIAVAPHAGYYGVSTNATSSLLDSGKPAAISLE